MRSSSADVERFLADVRKAIQTKNCEIREKRWRFFETLEWLGWTEQDAIDCIAQLRYGDYIKGPEEDENERSSEPYWMFKKREGLEDIYIKLKIQCPVSPKLIVKSFHIDNLR